MPDTKPRQPATTAPTTGDGTPSSAPASGDKTEKQDAPFVWPRDLNAPSSDSPEWGTDPEALRDV
jgi:hypothetical protein